MMSFCPSFSAYSKQPTQNVHCKEGFDGSPNTLQWFPMNPNKQDASRSIGYGEMPNYEREQVLNWYQTVPLRHDSFPEDVNPKETVQEQMNRKGKTSWNCRNNVKYGNMKFYAIVIG